MDDLIYDAYSIFFQLAQMCAPDFYNSIEIEMITFILSGVFLLTVVIGLLSVWLCVVRLLLKLGASE